MAEFDDGGGPALYAGGAFQSIGSVAASNIARWNGTGWSALGSGANDTVLCLAVHDDGGGPALYAGGSFSSMGGVAVGRVARWNGASWSAVGSPGLDNQVRALVEFDDGTGATLHAGGFFTNVGSGVARWNGSSWSPLGSLPGVHALAVFDDGSGPALHAGGGFVGALAHIARWNGAAWSPLGPGRDGTVFALRVFDDGGGPALFAGGELTGFRDARDSFLARWTGCPDSADPVLLCPASVEAVEPFGSALGVVVHFSVTASDNMDPAPNVVCVPPSGSLFPRGTTLVLCTATDATGNQSTCEFPVTVHLKARRQRL